MSNLRRVLVKKGNGFTITKMDRTEFVRNGVLAVVACGLIAVSMTMYSASADEIEEQQVYIGEQAVEEPVVTELQVQTLEMEEVGVPVEEQEVTAVEEMEVVAAVPIDEIAETEDGIDYELDIPQEDFDRVYDQVVQAMREAYTEYWYAIYDPENGNERTDVTFEQISMAEQMLEPNIDPHLLYAIIMTESHGKTTAANSSGATGLGQITVGTGRSIWTKMYGFDSASYSKNLLFDGNINTALAARYLIYLKDTQSSVYGMIDAYRGCHDSGYISKIDTWLNRAGTSLAEINARYF